MRTIERTNVFKRDFKRHNRGKHREALQSVFPAIVNALVNDMPLPERHHDHELAGQYHGLRECHIRPDLLLIYRILGDGPLELIALGTHAELFG